MKNGLYLVSTPIGNLSDITSRAVEVLRRADLVYAEDTRRTGILLSEIEADSAVRSLHEHNEASRTGEILSRLRSGERCALVSDAGTPAISDPGRRVVAAALEAGATVVPIPGPSAVLAALAVSGLPADRFCFLGFAPRRGAEREGWMARAEALESTLVVFESPRRLAALLREWRDRGMGDRRCVLCRELTKKFEEIRPGTVSGLLEQVADREIRGEVTVVLAGASPSSWEEARPEIEAEARDLLRSGRSTRDVVAALGDAYGIPRNEAYDLALRLDESDG